MSKLFKRTKILATIGPSVFGADKVEEIIMAGVNGCRLNCSHGTNEERDEQIKWIRDAAAKKGRSVAILQDLQGPKIRLGTIKDNHLDLKAGDELILEAKEDFEHDGGMTVPIQYNLASKVKVGEPLSMFDGKVKSTVTEIVSSTAIKVEILNDGFIMSKKGLNLPDTDFGGDILTEKDLADIEYGAGQDYDYVALSFVQTAADIEKLKQILLSHGSTAKVIAKIETKKAISSDENLEAIVKAADGIMVARGDMAVEAGAEVVPIVQRKLIALCRKNSKLCIVATQMMGSMVESPEPSRAEVSDVANAVIQGFNDGIQHYDPSQVLSYFTDRGLSGAQATEMANRAMQDIKGVFSKEIEIPVVYKEDGKELYKTETKTITVEADTVEGLDAAVNTAL